MSVVTYTFIVFLLCTIVLYYIVPKKIQWVILLLASLVFYGYAGIEYLFLVIATAGCRLSVLTEAAEESGRAGGAGKGCGQKNRTKDQGC